MLWVNCIDLDWSIYLSFLKGRKKRSDKLKAGKFVLDKNANEECT